MKNYLGFLLLSLAPGRVGIRGYHSLHRQRCLRPERFRLFELSGNTLTVVLSNTSTGDVLLPVDVRQLPSSSTPEGTLTPLSAQLGLSAVLFGPANAGNVGGRWRTKTACRVRPEGNIERGLRSLRPGRSVRHGQQPPGTRFAGRSPVRHHFRRGRSPDRQHACHRHECPHPELRHLHLHRRGIFPRLRSQRRLPVRYGPH